MDAKQFIEATEAVFPLAQVTSHPDWPYQCRPYGKAEVRFMQWMREVLYESADPKAEALEVRGYLNELIAYLESCPSIHNCAASSNTCTKPCETPAVPTANAPPSCANLGSCCEKPSPSDPPPGCEDVYAPPPPRGSHLEPTGEP
jgi:hypothetical protein